MKLLSRFLLVTTAVMTFASAENDPPGRVARINLISGPVSFRPGGVDDWVDATLNRPLTTGDHLWTDRGARAEMHIGSAALRLNSETAFEFLNLDDNNVQIRLGEGTLSVHLRRLDENESFEVDTPNVAFSLLRPGDYRIDVNPDSQQTIVTVRGGEGEVTGGSQAFSVRNRQQARVSGDDNITYDLSDALPPDGWDDWCMNRDRREERSESARYVSRDMIGYQDLDDYGYWRTVPEYGAIWAPRGVAVGWAPYRYGHWVWVDPWGWTWVDDAPWGFAPFHYGRWVFVAGAWGWIPGPVAVRPVYAPALVAWVGGPRFSLSISIGGGAGVAWFPLGPREVYVPAYRASPTYITRVNTTNTVINNINVTNIYNNTNVTNVRYVNQTVPGAVTAVPQNTLASGQAVSRAAVPVRPDQMATAQVMNTAPVAPRRESALGVNAASAGSAPRPPQAVMNRPVVARNTPPPPPVPWSQRQQALAANPGHPLDTATLQSIRERSGAPVARPYVRPVGPAASMPSGAGRTQTPAGFGAGRQRIAPPAAVSNETGNPQVNRPVERQWNRPMDRPPSRIERPAQQPQQTYQPPAPPQNRPEVARPMPERRERPAPQVQQPPPQREQRQAEKEVQREDRPMREKRDESGGEKRRPPDRDR